MMRSHMPRLVAVAVLSFMLLSFFSMPALAQASAGSIVGKELPSGSFQPRSLDVSLTSAGDYSFAEAKADKVLSFTVRNTLSSRIDVYAAIFKDEKWHVLDKLGTLDPGAQGAFEYTVNFSYNGKTTEHDTFGVIGSDGKQYVGHSFDIREEWGQYEVSLQSTLSLFGVVSAAFMLGILIIALVSAFTIASFTKHEEEAGPGEYTLRTLFFPRMNMRPIGERIANIIVTPWFWAVELVCGAMLIALILSFTMMEIQNATLGILIFVIGGVAAVFTPVVFLILGYFFDYYEREPFRFIIAMFMWGVMSTFIAFTINTTLSLFLGVAVDPTLSALLIAVLIAPIVEETAKGTGLLIISGHHEYDGVLDGIIYGFAIGMGFAAVENWLYFASNASPIAVGGLPEWAYNILYRSILCSLAHGCFTATTGAVIGLFKQRKNLRDYAFTGFIFGLPLAIFLHGLFNFSAILDVILQEVTEKAFGVPIPVFDPILTIGVTLIYVIIGIVLQRDLRKKARLEGQGQG